MKTGGFSAPRWRNVAVVRTGIRRRGLSGAVLLALHLVGISGETMAEGAGGADRLKSVISFRYPGTEWVARESLSRWMLDESASPFILLDTRSPEEYDVSHLSQALRVAPDVEASSLSHIPHSTRIVVYCSVGYRSAAVARRLSKAGFESVYNLVGGIFGWTNDGRPVYRGELPASTVHPYDRIWGKMLDGKYHPEN